VFSIAEVVELLDIADVNQSASSFNPEKLLWLNQQHIIETLAGRLGQLLRPYLERAGLDSDNRPARENLADGFRK